MLHLKYSLAFKFYIQLVWRLYTFIKHAARNIIISISTSIIKKPCCKSSNKDTEITVIQPCPTESNNAPLETMQSLTNDLRSDTLNATKKINFSSHKANPSIVASKQIPSPEKIHRLSISEDSTKKPNKLRKGSMECDLKKVEDVKAMLKQLALN